MEWIKPMAFPRLRKRLNTTQMSLQFRLNNASSYPRVSSIKSHCLAFQDAFPPVAGTLMCTKCCEK